MAEPMPKSPDRGQIERVHCNTCGDKTKHDVLLMRTQEGSEPYDDQISIWWTTVYTLYECRGCEAVCLKREYFFSEWNPGDSQIEFFPPAVMRDPPTWSNRLPEAEQQLLVEVYRAIAANSRRLALMGARALVDMFIVRTIGDEGGFGAKLGRLQTDGYISKFNREVLEAALEAGNASAHRGYNPTSAQLDTVMDIVENLLQAQLLHSDAQQLSSAVPKRPKKGQ